MDYGRGSGRHDQQATRAAGGGLNNKIDSVEKGLNRVSDKINNNINEKFEKLTVSMAQMSERVSENKAPIKYVEGALSSSVFRGGVRGGRVSKESRRRPSSARPWYPPTSSDTIDQAPPP